jgi:predicted dehydrogenase
MYRELEDFCGAIRTGATPRSSAALGLEVVRTIEAVDASLANGGARVEITTTASGNVGGARDLGIPVES